MRTCSVKKFYIFVENKSHCAHSNINYCCEDERSYSSNDPGRNYGIAVFYSFSFG